MRALDNTTGMERARQAASRLIHTSVSISTPRAGRVASRNPRTANG